MKKEEPALQCNYHGCKYKTDNKYNMNIHFQRHLPKIVECPFCSIKLPAMRMCPHVKKLHPKKIIDGEMRKIWKLPIHPYAAPIGPKKRDEEESENSTSEIEKNEEKVDSTSEIEKNEEKVDSRSEDLRIMALHMNNPDPNSVITRSKSRKLKRQQGKQKEDALKQQNEEKSNSQEHFFHIEITAEEEEEDEKHEATELDSSRLQNDEDVDMISREGKDIEEESDDDEVIIT